MRLIFIIFLICLSAKTGQTQADTSWLKVSLLTCDPGDDLYASFGHSGIRVLDRKRNKDIVFDYGVFDFGTPNFVWRFMRGNLDYKLAVRKTNRFMREYVRDERGVISQDFNLPEAQLVEIYNFLLNNQKPENRYYKYNFLHDNCSTRIRDFVNDMEVTKGVSSKPLKDTYRNYLHNFLEQKLWLKFGIDILLGARTDRVMSYDAQQFLPQYLSDNLEAYSTTYKGKKELLLKPANTLIPSGKPVSEFNFLQPLIVLSVLFLLIVGLCWWRPKLVKPLFYILSLLFGIAGCLLLFLWFGTEHTATKVNWNLLWANPLYLLLLFPVRFKPVLTKVLLVLNAVLVLAWFFIPQEMNVAVLPLVGMAFFLLVKFAGFSGRVV